jgi:GTP cyclohydrolase I
LQIQERLVQDVADVLEKVAATEHVAVVADGEHLCMTMRGVKSPAILRTSVMRGAFREDPRARAEFLAIARKGER